MLESNADSGDAQSHVSTFSGTGNCVKVVKLPNGTYVVTHSRDDTPGISFTCDEWKAFIAGVKGHEFDF